MVGVIAGACTANPFEVLSSQAPTDAAPLPDVDVDAGASAPDAAVLPPTCVDVSLEPPPASVCLGGVTLSGTRCAGVAVVVDGSVVVGEGAATQWSAMVALVAGVNTLEVWGRAPDGRESSRQSVTVIYDDTPPTPPMVTGAPEFTDTATLSFTATVTEAVTLRVDGVGAASGDRQIAFDVPLSLGTNQRVIDVVDACGRPSDSVMRTSTRLRAVRVVSSELPPASGDPALARSRGAALASNSDGVVAVAWQDNADRLEAGNDEDVFLAAAPGAMALASDGAHDGRSRNPRISAGAAGTLWVVWRDDGDYDGDATVDDDIVYRRFVDGLPDGAVQLISSGPTDGRSVAPDVASQVDGSPIVVWQDDGDLDGDATAEPDIYLATLADAWSPTLISDGAADGRSLTPRVAVGACPHVVWVDDGIDGDGANDVFLRSFELVGALCEPTAVRPLSDAPEIATVAAPAVAVDSAEVVWVAFRAIDAAGASRIIARSVTAGAPGPQQIVSAAPNSRDVAIAIDGNDRVHVTWADDTGIWARVLGEGVEPVSDVHPWTVRAIEPAAPAVVIAGRERIISWEDHADHDGDAVADSDIVLR